MGKTTNLTLFITRKNDTQVNLDGITQFYETNNQKSIKSDKQQQKQTPSAITPPITMECAQTHSNGSLDDVIATARAQFGKGLVGDDATSGSSCSSDSPRHSPSLTQSSSSTSSASSLTSSPSPRKQYIDEQYPDCEAIQFTTVGGNSPPLPGANRTAKPTQVANYTPNVKKQLKQDIELPLRPDQG